MVDYIDGLISLVVVVVACLGMEAHQEHTAKGARTSVSFGVVQQLCCMARGEHVVPYPSVDGHVA